MRTIETPDEPRTATERQVDFAIGVIVGAAIAGAAFVMLLDIAPRLVESLGVGGLVLGLFVILGCGYLNYRLGSALWSRR